MQKLKPCPFCGGKAAFHNCAELENEAMAAKITGQVGIHCCTCRVATLPYESHEEAAAAWNRRAEQT